MARAKAHKRAGGSRTFTKKTIVHTIVSSKETRRKEVKKTLTLQGLQREHIRGEERVQTLLSGSSQETVTIVRPGLQPSLQGGHVGEEPMVIDGPEHQSDWIDEDLPVEQHFLDALYDVSQTRNRNRSTRSKRTWKQRRKNEEAAWAPLIEPLADRYLVWKYGNSPNLTTAPSSAPSMQDPVTAPHSSSSNPQAASNQKDQPESLDQPETAPHTTGFPFTIEIFDLFNPRTQITINRPSDSVLPTLDLMEHGFIAKTPLQPTLAISISTLELLYRLRRRKASFSVEAFVKVVCDYYGVGVKKINPPS